MHNIFGQYNLLYLNLPGETPYGTCTLWATLDDGSHGRCLYKARWNDAKELEFSRGDYFCLEMKVFIVDQGKFDIILDNNTGKYKRNPLDAHDRIILMRGEEKEKSYILYKSRNGDIVFNYGETITLASKNVPLDTWLHLAINRNKEIFYMFINGVLCDQQESNEAISTTGDVYLGVDKDGMRFLNGFISDLRITKGSRYVENFESQIAN